MTGRRQSFVRALLVVIVVLVMATLCLFVMNEDDRATWSLARRELFHQIALTFKSFKHAPRVLVMLPLPLTAAPPPFNVTFCSLVSGELSIPGIRYRLHGSRSVATGQREVERLSSLFRNLSRPGGEHDVWVLHDNRPSDERRSPLWNTSCSDPGPDPLAPRVHLMSQRHVEYNGAFSKVLSCLLVHRRRVDLGERNVLVKLDPDAFIPEGRLGPLLDRVVSTCSQKSPSFRCAFGNVQTHPTTIFFSGLFYGSTFAFPTHAASNKDEHFAAEDLYFAELLLTRAREGPVSVIDLRPWIDVHAFDPARTDLVVQHNDWKKAEAKQQQQSKSESGSGSGSVSGSGRSGSGSGGK
jgi:uncharacterized membrane protein YgcG